MNAIKLFLLLYVLSLSSNLSAQTSPYIYHLLIGTYAVEGKPNGIHVYRFNAKSGEYDAAQPVTELLNASYLAISRDRKNVYAVSEGGGGSVNAYAFNPESGALTFMNSVPAQGPCYVSVDNKKKVVFTGNYGGGSIVSVHLNKDGSFVEENVQTLQHKGSSIVKGRQDKPHVHSVVLSLDDRYLLVPDLGTDKVYQYRIDAMQEKALAAADVPFLPVHPGGGPRHLTFHPNGKYAYLVLELEGAVMALDYRDGKLAAKQTVSMAPPDFKGQVSGADIHVSPDGKFLYASNRGDANEIAIFSIDKQGRLASIGRQSVFGKTPRNFVIDPTGNFLLVANQNTNEVIIFKRDKTTGQLTPTGKKIEADKPVCLKFVAVGQ
ncbi:MAG: lactonase family protein [Cyclobacteriaceae bacterium]|nr:lactonase family protein [Cyclobacteriaceae bacterium]MDH5249216.1 lactonase family protein [Cyclobacteriaceae bacterium]